MTTPDAVEALAAALRAHEANLLALGRTMIEPRPDDWEPLLGERIAAAVNGLNVVRQASALAAAGYPIVREEEGLGNVEAWSQRWNDFVNAVTDTGLDEATRIALIDYASAAAEAAARLPAPPPALDVERCPCGHLNATCTRPTLAERAAYEREGE